MILRDPIHGIIDFADDEERVIQALLDTTEVQRLRRVRQLGLASMVFPGAEHSRFSHALGTAWVMSRLLERIKHLQHAVPHEQRLDPASRLEAIAAAFLHDLGHGPFSHLYEELRPGAANHEQWTSTLILAPDTEVHRALQRFGRDTPRNVAELTRGRHRIAYLGPAVSGPLDVDRFDYLPRDSHMTGVSYGVFERDWLLRSLTLGQGPRVGGPGCAVLALEGRKGLPPVEGFFRARNSMYQQVYHHKAVRAAEALVRAMFARVSERLRDPADGLTAPMAMIRGIRGDSVSVSEYLSLDDAALMSCIAAWQHDADSVLADLARRFMRRRLPKTLPLPVTPGSESLWVHCKHIASQLATARGLRADLHVWLDVPSDGPDAGKSTAGKPATGKAPWVSMPDGSLQPLVQLSPFLRDLTKKPAVPPRLIFPPELREEIVRAVQPLIGPTLNCLGVGETPIEDDIFPLQHSGEMYQ